MTPVTAPADDVPPMPAWAGTKRFTARLMVPALLEREGEREHADIWRGKVSGWLRKEAALRQPNAELDALLAERRAM